MTSIREAVPGQHWRHCSGTDNPADLPSRGVSVAELQHNPLWLNGPDWLQGQMDEDVDETVPQGCLDEMKKSAMDVHSLVAVQENASQISQVMDCAHSGDSFE